MHKKYEKEDTISQYPKVKEKLNLLKETLEDDIEHLQISQAEDAKVGYKTADSSFFGYKTHIAMSEERCSREGAKSKSYSVSIKSDVHTEQAESQERYKIEAKNSELKYRHGYDVASSSGLVGMEMQGAMVIFAVNLKRILKTIGN